MCKRCGDEAADHGGVEFKTPWAIDTLGEVMKYTKERNTCEIDVNDDAIQGAAMFLSEASAFEVKPPALGPVTGGGLGFEFKQGHRGLDVEVFPDGQTLEFMLVIARPGKTPETADLEYELGAIPVSEIQDVRWLFQWFTTGEFSPELATYLYTDEELEAKCSSSENGSSPETPSA